MSPGEAVHGYNHDYHVLVQQRVTKPAGNHAAAQCVFPESFFCGTAAHGPLTLRGRCPSSAGNGITSVQCGIRLMRLLL